MKRAHLMLGLLLSGCAVGPRYHAPRLDLAPRFREAVAADPGPVPVPTAFWAAFGDSTLERLTREALAANQDVRIAEARVRGARAARLDAALDLAPTVVAVGGYTRQRLPGAFFPGGSGTLPDQSLWDLGVQASWELDLFGRVRRNLQGRSALVAAAQEDVRDVQVLLTAELAGAYFDLRGAEQRLATATQNAANQRRTLQLTVDRLNAGRGDALDSERARAQLNSTLAVIPPLEATIAAARYRIGVLVGRAPEAVVIAAGDAGPAATPTLPDSLMVPSPDSLIQFRPDVRSAERRLAAQTALVGAATAEYLPRVTLDASVGLTAGSAGALGDEATRRYAVGPVVSWPALNLGRVKAGVDAAHAREVEASARYEQTVLLALEDVETSLVRYRKARERLELLDQAAAASQRAAELARLRFQEGASDFLQVLDAERRLLEAQDQQVSGRTDAYTRLVDVYRALGGSWPTAGGAAPGGAS